MLKAIRLIAVVACAIVALPAVALDYSIPFDVAAVRVFNPASPAQIGGGAHVFGPGGGYIQPAIVQNFLTTFGDSRTALTGGLTWNSPTVTSAAAMGTGYSGYLPPLSGNKFIYEYGYNYGIGAQTSAGTAARAATTSVYCDDPTATSNTCFQALKATTSGAYTTASTSITLTGFSGTITNGVTYVVQINAYLTTNCQITANGSNLTTTSVTIPSGCIQTGFSSAQTIVFVPLAQANAFWNYIGGYSLNNYGSGTDVSLNKVGGGTNFPTCTTATGCTLSPATDTAQVIALLVGINDANLGAVQSALNLASIFSNLGPQGPGAPNKIIVVGDEYPSGLATGYSQGGSTQNGAAEIQTIPASPTACGATYTSNYCVTVHNAGTFFSEPSESLPPLLVYYAPAGTGTVPFVAGASDGVALTYCGSLGCVPAAGQFGVDATGHYAFSSGDASKKVGIYYRYTATTSGRGAFIAELHNWYDSTSCAASWTNGGTYAGSGFSVTMQNPGAQCPGLNPWARVAGTWPALLDTSSGNNYYNKPYTLVDGLHPLPHGAALLSQAMLSAAATSPSVIPASAPYVVPTANNFAINATTQTGTGTQTHTCTYGTDSGQTQQKYYLSAVTMGGVSLSSVSGAVASSLVGATLYTPNATYFPAATTIKCVDQTNGLLQLSAAATGASSTIYALGSGYIIARLDTASIGAGGVFSYAYGSYTGLSAAAGTFVTGCGGTSANASCPAPSIAGWTISHTLPVNWYLTLDANSQTAVAAGTLGVSFGMASNPLGDGYDGVVFQLQGYAYAAAGNPVLTLSDTINGQLAALLTSGTQLRGICRVLIGPGPNGHLTGLTGVQVKVSDQMTGTFTAPGMNGITGQSSYTTAAASAGGGANELSDIDAASGSPGVVAVSGVPGGYMQELDYLTPPITLAATSNNSVVLSTIVQFNPYDAVSATVLIERCAADLGAQ